MGSPCQILWLKVKGAAKEQKRGELFDRARVIHRGGLPKGEKWV